jgi:hypothetical protein
MAIGDDEKYEVQDVLDVGICNKLCLFNVVRQSFYFHNPSKM